MRALPAGRRPLPLPRAPSSTASGRHPRYVRVPRPCARHCGHRPQHGRPHRPAPRRGGGVRSRAARWPQPQARHSDQRPEPRRHPTRLKQLGRHTSYAILDEYLALADPFESHPLSGVLSGFPRVSRRGRISSFRVFALSQRLAAATQSSRGVAVARATATLQFRDATRI